MRNLDAILKSVLAPLFFVASTNVGLACIPAPGQNTTFSFLLADKVVASTDESPWAFVYESLVSNKGTTSRALNVVLISNPLVDTSEGTKVEMLAKYNDGSDKKSKLKSKDGVNFLFLSEDGLAGPVSLEVVLIDTDGSKDTVHKGNFEISRPRGSNCGGNVF